MASTYHYRPSPRDQYSHFDRNSGLVFSETTIPARPSRLKMSDMSKRLRKEHPRTGATGAASLEDMCIRVLLAHATCLTQESLQGLPWTIGRRLWKEIDKRRLTHPKEIREVMDGFTLWKTFASAYPLEPETAYYRNSENAPSLTLPEYVSRFQAPQPDPFRWLTCLMISNLSFSRADIMSLSNLRNLRALDVCSKANEVGTPELVSDDVIRWWAKHVEEIDAFPKLRVLVLRNQEGVTPQSFKYLNAFPSLTLFGVKGCRVGMRDHDVAEKNGWSNKDEDRTLEALQKDIEHFTTWDGPLLSCLNHAPTTKAVHEDDDGNGEDDNERTSDPEDDNDNDSDNDNDNDNGSDTSLPSLKKQAPPPSPKVCFRIGPTSSDVLYSTPIMFFRSIHTQRPARHTVRIQQPTEVQSTFMSKTQDPPHHLHTNTLTPSQTAPSSPPSSKSPPRLLSKRWKPGSLKKPAITKTPEPTATTANVVQAAKDKVRGRSRRRRQQRNGEGGNPGGFEEITGIGKGGPGGVEGVRKSVEDLRIEGAKSH
ncbi:MAG: hypothetical protein M1831_006424 [Alyxoria varia]|nr:MAG: hypothetical protein M1831_006424 [Alyxoria varia]